MKRTARRPSTSQPLPAEPDPAARSANLDEPAESARDAARNLASVLYRAPRTQSAKSRLLVSDSVADLSDALDRVEAAGPLVIDRAPQPAEPQPPEETRYETLFELAPNGYLVTDASGRILQGNRASASLLRTRPARLVGKTVQSFVRGATLRAFPGHLSTLLRAGRLDGWELSVQPEGGARLHLLASVAASRDADGRIFAMRWQLQDITERKRREDRVAFLAYHDPLTGLPNRRLFEELVPFALARADRDGSVVGLLLIDLDDFKSVNDTLGHLAGDRVLERVGKRLRGLTRATDLVARWGGDEFVLVLGDLAGERPASGAPAGERDRTDRVPEAVAARTAAAIREPIPVSGAALRVSASIGVSLLPADAANIETLLEHADAAMYRSKRRGPGGHAVYGAEA